MKLNRASLLACTVLTLVALVTVSCQTSPASPGDKKTIVATYSVLGSLVKEMVGDLAIVRVSTPNGLDPHEWEPSAKDIEVINKADLVVRNGLGLEPGLQKTLEAARARGVKLFTASDHVPVRRVGPGEGLPTGDPDQAVGAPDPHLWTDPLTMKGVVTALATTLKADLGLDVTARAADLEKRLDSLNKEVADIINAIPAENRKLVTGHESMGYFAQRYGLKLIGVIVPSLSSQADVSAANLAALKKAIEENKVRAIFTELGTSPAVAAAIARDTGARVIELTTHALPQDGSYFTFVKDMANVIAGALK